MFVNTSENTEGRVSNAIPKLEEKKTTERKEHSEELLPDISHMCDIDKSIPPVRICLTMLFRTITVLSEWH